MKHYILCIITFIYSFNIFCCNLKTKNNRTKARTVRGLHGPIKEFSIRELIQRFL